MLALPLKDPLQIHADSRLGFRSDFNGVKRDYFDDDRQSRDAHSIGRTRVQKTEENAQHSVEINIDFDKFDSKSVQVTQRTSKKDREASARERSASRKKDLSAREEKLIDKQLGQIEIEPSPDPWRLKKKTRLAPSSTNQIKDYLAVLRTVEKEVASIDDYVKDCISKYGLFAFEIKQFYSDELIAKAKFVERYRV